MKSIVSEILQDGELIDIGTDTLEFVNDDITSMQVKLDGTVTENHMKSTLNIIAQDSITALDLIEQAYEYSALRSSSGGSNYLYAWDTSRTIMIYTTIYYSTSIVNGNECLSLSSISGGYSADGLNGTSIISNSLTYGQSGWGTGTQSATTTFSTSTSSWTVYPSSLWAPVPIGVSHTVGAYYSVQLQRPNGHTWSVGLSNNI